MFEMEKAPFRVEGDTDETLLEALGEKIAQEIQSACYVGEPMMCSGNSFHPAGCGGQPWEGVGRGVTDK